MADYRRMYELGGMYFFTVVTHRRRDLFSNDKARECLRMSISQIRAQRPFEMVASVLLPDHLHCIWKLPDGDADFSTRWACIKKEFSKLWIAQCAGEIEVSNARKSHREVGVWQRRFWEHRIRNEDDMICHVNYIHYNPVKHGVVRCPHDWAHSSFHRWVKDGYYRADWLCDCLKPRSQQPSFASIETAGE